jgi:hypothetical protein
MVLLDQIVETISFKRQRAATSGRGEVLAEKLQSRRSLTEQIAESILYFVREEQDAGRVFRSEADLIGALSGFLVGLEWGLDVLPEARVGPPRFDLLIIKATERIIIEVNYGRFKQDYIEAAIAKVRTSAASAKACGAILIFLSDSDMDAFAHRLTEDDARTELWVVGNTESYLKSLRKQVT